jgi:hypothetical protein
MLFLYDWLLSNNRANLISQEQLADMVERGGFDRIVKYTIPHYSKLTMRQKNPLIFAKAISVKNLDLVDYLINAQWVMPSGNELLNALDDMRCEFQALGKILWAICVYNRRIALVHWGALFPGKPKPRLFDAFTGGNQSVFSRVFTAFKVFNAEAKQDHVVKALDALKEKLDKKISISLANFNDHEESSRLLTPLFFEEGKRQEMYRFCSVSLNSLLDIIFRNYAPLAFQALVTSQFFGSTYRKDVVLKNLMVVFNILQSQQAHLGVSTVKTLVQNYKFHENHAEIAAASTKHAEAHTAVINLLDDVIGVPMNENTFDTMCLKLTRALVAIDDINNSLPSDPRKPV